MLYLKIFFWSWGYQNSIFADQNDQKVDFMDGLVLRMNQTKRAPKMMTKAIYRAIFIELDTVYKVK